MSNILRTIKDKRWIMTRHVLRHEYELLYIIIEMAKENKDDQEHHTSKSYNIHLM